MPDAMDVLRRELEFVDAASALSLLKAIRRLDRPGSLTLVLVDDDRRLVDFFVVEDGAEQLVYVVERIVEADWPEVSALFLVTDRTGEGPADRPDDELVWWSCHRSPRSTASPCSTGSWCGGPTPSRSRSSRPCRRSGDRSRVAVVDDVVVEVMGIEPTASAMPWLRSTN